MSAASQLRWTAKQLRMHAQSLDDIADKLSPDEPDFEPADDDVVEELPVQRDRRRVRREERGLEELWEL